MAGRTRSNEALEVRRRHGCFPGSFFFWMTRTLILWWRYSSTMLCRCCVARTPRRSCSRARTADCRLAKCPTVQVLQGPSSRRRTLVVASSIPANWAHQQLMPDSPTPPIFGVLRDNTFHLCDIRIKLAVARTSPHGLIIQLNRNSRIHKMRMSW